MKKLTRTVILFLAVATFVPEEAFGVLGTRRRTSRRTAVVVGSSVKAADSAEIAQSQQQAQAAQAEADAAKKDAAEANEEAENAKKEAEAAKQQAAAATPTPAPAATPTPAPAPAVAPAPVGKLPLGTVVASLPPGSVAQPVNGVQYYHDGTNYYRAVFQGNTLVYVTAEAK